ncbi:MAG: M1 family aminopeptidase [Pyrinomonadaceae bacterium]
MANISLITLLLISTIELNGQSGGSEIYQTTKEISIDRAANVTDLTILKDRVKMTFSGTFYLGKSIDGTSTAAYFEGRGRIYSESADIYEKAYLKRLIRDDKIDAEFKKGYFRFNDGVFAEIEKNSSDTSNGSAAEAALKDHESRIMEETGQNISSYLMLQKTNKEESGFFVGTFDDGSLDRFTYVFDPQKRFPTKAFGVNAGESGVIFSYWKMFKFNDVWSAFYPLINYEQGYTAYSDVYDIIDTEHYDIDVDATDPKKNLGLTVTIEAKTRLDNIVAIPFEFGTGLGEYDNTRKRKQLRLTKALVDGVDAEIVQEDWEKGATIVMPNSAKKGQTLKITLELNSDFFASSDFFEGAFYPSVTDSWYPQHGYLDKATYKVKFKHQDRYEVPATGIKISRSKLPDGKFAETIYEQKKPVTAFVFAVGQFIEHSQEIKWDDGSAPMKFSFYAWPDSIVQVREKLMMAELDNSLRYFNNLFGKYPYETFGCFLHPYNVGRGFATMVVLPRADFTNKYNYAFIAHEASHQWWGNKVVWRSYRDQWLSEGFAEYSSIMYVSQRDSYKATDNMLKSARESLLDDPGGNDYRWGDTRAIDLGPIILGGRLHTSKSFSGYSRVVYAKGAWVMRMLHYLFTDPATGDPKPFLEMMSSFIEKHKDELVTTEQFVAHANEHFKRTKLAQTYRLQDLQWFFDQWVYGTDFPEIDISYKFTKDPNGGVIFEGLTKQKGITGKFFMPVPVALQFGKDKMAYVTVPAYGESQPFRIKLPQQPSKVEFDPQRWLLVDKLSSSEAKN